MFKKILLPIILLFAAGFASAQSPLIPAVGGNSAPTTCIAGTYACLGVAQSFTAVQTFTSVMIGDNISQHTPTLQMLFSTQGFSPGANSINVIANGAVIAQFANNGGSNTRFQIAGTMPFQWTSGPNVESFGSDTSLSRLGPAQVGCGNGTQGDITCTFSASIFTAGTSLSIGGGTSLNTTNQSGTGSIAMTTSPTFVTPILGVAAGTTFNKITITTPATGATLTLVNGSTLTLNGAFSTQFTGSANATFTLPGASDTLVGLGATQTLTAKTLTSPAINTATIAGGTVNNAIIGGTTPLAGSFTALKGTTLLTTTTCGAVGTAASPSLVACGAAASGVFSCSATASTGTCVVSDTAVTANSTVVVTPITYANTRLTVTCNTAPVNTAASVNLVSAISAGASFTINVPTITSNPTCYSYAIYN